MKELLQKLLELIFGKQEEPKSILEKKGLKPLPLREDSKPKRRNMLHAKNDSKRLKNELVTLKSKNEKLHDLIIDLYKWIDKEIGKDTVITMIYRTQSEQDAIYKGTFRGARAYDENPWKSPHQVWTAIDLRTSIYTKEEINKIKDYLDNKYNSSNYYKITAMYHEVTDSKGRKLGRHFHIQYT